MMVTDNEIKELLIKIKKNAKIEFTKLKVDEVTLKGKTLGGQIQYYRKINNMTQEDLANRVNLSRDAIIKYENNYRLANYFFLKFHFCVKLNKTIK